MKGHYKPHTKKTKLWLSQMSKGVHKSPDTEFKKGHIMPQEVKDKIRKTMLTLKERHHNWKGGITDENVRIRNSSDHRNWSMEVYRQDKWTCRMCKRNCKKGDIIAHHIMLFSDFPTERFNTKNGITLHRSCHASLHQLYERTQHKI